MTYEVVNRSGLTYLDTNAITMCVCDLLIDNARIGIPANFVGVAAKRSKYCFYIAAIDDADSNANIALRAEAYWYIVLEVNALL